MNLHQRVHHLSESGFASSPFCRKISLLQIMENCLAARVLGEVTSFQEIYDINMLEFPLESCTPLIMCHGEPP